MTNREWVKTLSDEEFANWVINEALAIYMQYTNPTLALEGWLKKKKPERRKNEENKY